MARPKFAIPSRARVPSLYMRLRPLLDKGLALQHANDLDGAEQLYREILAKDPNHAEALQLLGLIYNARGIDNTAEELITRAIELLPIAQFYANRAVARVGLKKYDEALADCEKALALDPNCLDAVNNKALVLARLQRFEEAVDYSREYLKLRPDYDRAWFNLAVSLQEYGRHEESLEYYEGALRLNPNKVTCYVNMANAHKEMSNWAEAQRLLTIAEGIDPTFAETYNIRAAVLKEIGKPNASLAYFTRAQELDSKKHMVYEYNKGLSQLLAGIMPHGWASFEHRFTILNKPKVFENYRSWQGFSEPLDGKILVVVREQGVGDFIQFCRYIPMIKQRYPTCYIKVHCDKGMEELTANIPGVDEVLKTDTEVQLSWDYWINVMSLPWVFTTSMDTIPNQVPYLFPKAEHVAAWAEHMPQDKIRVGLVWSGGFRADMPNLWTVNGRRNCDWSLFEDMVLKVREQRDDIEFYSLQKGDPYESDFRARLTEVDLPVINLVNDVKSWEDTASMVSNLDLIIAVDTSTAHLAGALGKPVWLLNRLDTCWRWFLRRTDSPWYPTMRIFRQIRPKDWRPVVDEITKNLLDFKK